MILIENQDVEALNRCTYHLKNYFNTCGNSQDFEDLEKLQKLVTQINEAE